MLGRLKLTADAMHAAADIGARDSTADTLGHDSFLAANWQQYVDFVECVLHKVGNSCFRTAVNLLPLFEFRTGHEVASMSSLA